MSSDQVRLTPETSRGPSVTPVASCAATMPVDRHYCSNCGCIRDPAFEPDYRSETYVPLMFEVGIRAWPFRQVSTLYFVP